MALCDDDVLRRDGEPDVEQSTVVEFIPAFEDAKLRLACFHAVSAPGQLDFAHALTAAKMLYAWVMESEESAEDAGTTDTTAGPYVRNH